MRIGVGDTENQATSKIQSTLNNNDIGLTLPDPKDPRWVEETDKKITREQSEDVVETQSGALQTDKESVSEKMEVASIRKMVSGGQIVVFIVRLLF